jgi:hypothetical protein
MARFGGRRIGFFDGIEPLPAYQLQRFKISLRQNLLGLNHQTAVSRETRQSVPVRRASCARALRPNPRVEI